MTPFFGPKEMRVVLRPALAGTQKTQQADRIPAEGGDFESVLCGLSIAAERITGGETTRAD